ncbi:ABC transporter permease [Saccharomonospora piscinae]|uniref:ABC transporter permease n=1 Tax=Saccharomonospora piscinae TaxID=687388 RepID=UPI00046376DD|nr:ABC transporter permease [Saccharomonospora piscinae]
MTTPTTTTTLTTRPPRSAHALADSVTMLRRNLKHMVRYPSMTIMVIGMPVLFLLLFVYVFGETLGAGLGAAGAGRDAYVDYLTPGILLMGIGASAQGTAIFVAMDMTEGIVARFKTMPIARSAILAGHVLGSTLQTVVGLVVVVGVALLVGFRPTTGALDWLLAACVLTLIAFAITSLAVAMGMATRTVEAASNLPLPLVLLPFLGSGFVPTESMPSGLAFFAEYQPFTPFIDTVRGLLLGTPVGGSAAQALAWCAGITLVGHLWARRLFNRERPH